MRILELKEAANRAITGTLLASCLLILQACGTKDSTRADVLVVEGKGVEGICNIGENIASVERLLGRPSKSVRWQEEGSISEVEYMFGPVITVDTINRGDGEKIARLSFLSGSGSALSADHSTKHKVATLSIRTAKGLELSPQQSLRQAAIDVYGPPIHSYKTFSEMGIADSIRQGIAYSVTVTPDVEYIHYPSEGIAFVIDRGMISKCSVEEPFKRQIWRF